MSWARRRQSGEVINASLLEIFLALTFIIFGLAVFEQRRAAAAERELAQSVPHSAVRMLHDSLSRLAAIAAAQADSLLRAQATIDSLVSRYPGDCDQGELAEVILVTLTPTGRLQVEVTRDFVGFRAGQRMELSPPAFRARFAEVVRYSRERDCLFKARIRDTPGVTKAAFKESMSAVTSIFRYRDAFR